MKKVNLGLVLDYKADIKKIDEDEVVIYSKLRIFTKDGIELKSHNDTFRVANIFTAIIDNTDSSLRSQLRVKEDSEGDAYLAVTNGDYEVNALYIKVNDDYNYIGTKLNKEGFNKLVSDLEEIRDSLTELENGIKKLNLKVEL